MIRKIIIADLLTFLPVLLFASIGEIFLWICLTFVIGLIIAVFSFKQIKKLMHSMSNNEIKLTTPKQAGYLIPGLGGILLILPGLLTDLLAGIVLLGSLATLITSFSGNSKSQRPTSRSNHNRTTNKKRNDRVIDVDYETVDDNEKRK